MGETRKFEIGAGGECSLADILEEGRGERWLEGNCIVTTCVGVAESLHHLVISLKDGDVPESGCIDQLHHLPLTEGSNCKAVISAYELIPVLYGSSEVFSECQIVAVVIAAHFPQPLIRGVVIYIALYESEYDIPEVSCLHEQGR